MLSVVGKRTLGDVVGIARHDAPTYRTAVEEVVIRWQPVLVPDRT